MKITLGKVSLALVASAFLLSVSSGAFAQKTYLSSGSGGAVKDPFGDCLLSPGGTDIPECSGVAAPAPTAPVDSDIATSMAADANFAFDSATLKPAGMSALDQLVADMAPLNVQSVQIVGHTDSVGAEAYNQGLSERRAQSAANYLISKGVSSGLISASGAGESQPVASNSTAEGRAKNRRVDILVDATQ